ncbi:hypothetical protein HY375_01465 [Candidatus Berkelbacteria bacterium]|nr:hypothetical protein [Candidatus Berkelbacteria bacterium]
MVIMDSRYQDLVRAVDGYAATGQPLVGLAPGEPSPGFAGTLFAAGYSDDLGSYAFIPLIARLLDVSLDQAITIFFVGIIGLSTLLGLVGSWLLFRRWPERLMLAFGIAFLVYRSLRIGDVYVVPAMAVVAVLPLFLVLVTRWARSPALPLFLLVAGVGLGASQLIRAHAATPVILFILVLVLLAREFRWTQRLGLMASLAVGVLIPLLAMQLLVAQRDRYLHAHEPRYEERGASHPLWHPAYVGLGFLDNRYDIRWDDSVAAEAAKRIDPEAPYLSARYDAALKQAVLTLVRTDPLFILTTLAAKLGVLGLYFLLLANLGLLASLLFPKPIAVEWAFWPAIGFAALPALVALPVAPYFMGLAALAVLYGALSLAHAVSVWRTGGRPQWPRYQSRSVTL